MFPQSSNKFIIIKSTSLIHSININSKMTMYQVLFWILSCRSTQKRKGHFTLRGLHLYGQWRLSKKLADINRFCEEKNTLKENGGVWGSRFCCSTEKIEKDSWRRPPSPSTGSHEHKPMASKHLLLSTELLHLYLSDYFCHMYYVFSYISELWYVKLFNKSMAAQGGCFFILWINFKIYLSYLHFSF